MGLRSGLAQPLIKEKVDVGVAADLDDGALAGEYLAAHLGQILGEPVFMAFGAGGGPYRKPVLQVFDRGGEPLAYVKVGWNDWVRAAVRREATALQACATHPMELGVPAFLGLSSWHGLDLLVTGPLPLDSRRVSADTGLPPVSVLRQISELSPGSPASSHPVLGGTASGPGSWPRAGRRPPRRRSPAPSTKWNGPTARSC